ncbi:MAG: hypothetical protein RLZZ127_2591 [Planctomycetota bacterium]|jgi:fucokinase
MSSAPLHPLVAGWRRLHLTVAAPERAPAWDAVVLTASNPAQAALYRHELGALAARRRLPAATATLVVEDPQGRRIGSGGATLQVLRALAVRFGAGAADLRVLVIHAGGDSRRLPWASVAGKAFVPVPLLADPDDPPPSLAEHLLALVAGIPARLPAGALVALSGDVIPLGTLADLAWPADDLAAVATAAPLAVASRHGVFAVDAGGACRDLLQKADASALAAAGAVTGNGAALIDTGIWAATGSAYRRLLALAAADPDPVARILADGRELSLYEEISGAVIPSRAGWLAGRPIGPDLARALAGCSLRVLVSPDLRFLHLGTSTEYLDHLTRDWDGQRAGRVMAETGPGIADAAVVLASRAGSAVVGAGSVVAVSDLGPGCSVGRRCVVFGVDGGAGFRLPDHHCLWQVAVSGGWATAWCGVDDNPKDPLAVATFGNRPLRTWLHDRGIAPDEVWSADAERCLWTARLFPVAASAGVHAALGWMVDSPDRHPAGVQVWRAADRRSLADLAAAPDPAALAARRGDLLDRIAMCALAGTAAGIADRDAGRLARLVSPGTRAGLAALADGVSRWLPPARRAWLRADLLAAGGHPAAETVRAEAWPAIAAAVAASTPATPPPVAELSAAAAACALPARVDLAGGWSDTPPYALEHPAAVLNLAVLVDGRAPIAAEAVAGPGDGLRLELDGVAAGQAAWSDLVPQARFPLSDPAALLKTAAAVCGFGPGLRGGLLLRGSSRLPKGSGLGGSSILAAALVTVLQRIAGRPDDWRTVSELVLAVEQRLGTGGGWQDQVGGLVPGAKLVAAVPVHPIRLQVEPVPLGAGAAAALAGRLVLVDTGITRLARDVLQRVVGSYLARDRRVVAGIGRLADLARDGRDRLAAGDLDGLGGIIAEAWELNQSLDPLCSNPAVDALFAGTAPLCLGWKLCGAGGGGFAVALARDGAAAALADLLRRRGARPVAWSLAEGCQAPGRSSIASP